MTNGAIQNSSTQSRNVIDLTKFAVTKVTYTFEKGVQLSQYVLPQEYPEDWQSRARGKSHKNLMPPPSVATILAVLGLDIDFTQALGSGTFGRAFLAKKLPKGQAKCFNSFSDIICVKVTDLNSVSAYYEHHFLPRESYCLMTLNSQHTIKTYDQFILEIIIKNEKQRFFITAQEFLPYNLSALYYDNDGGMRTIPFEITKRLFVQLMKALNYLHSMGFAHRDVKISNMMLDSNFNLRLIDFGMTHLVQESTELDASNQPQSETKCGSNIYMSPEIVLEKQYSPQSYDCWLGGLFLLEAISKDFKGFSHLIEKNQTFDPSWIKFESNVPEEYKEMILSLVTIEEKRISIRQALDTNFCKLFDEEEFWLRYSNGSISQAFDAFKNKESSDGGLNQAKIFK